MGIGQVIFEDRDGDVLEVVPRSKQNTIPDPCLSIIRPHLMASDESLTILFTEDEFRDILKRLAAVVLEEDWGPVNVV